MHQPEVTKLYKYRTYSARNLSMLSNNEIYFSPSNSFNDPFDCLARKEMEFSDRNDLIARMAPLETHHRKLSMPEAIAYVESRTHNEIATKTYIEEKSKLFQKIVLQTFGIYSISEVNDDILMWSHYSDGHTGFCIEFNRDDSNFLGEAKPVEYPATDDFPFINYWVGDNDRQTEEFIKIILTKSRHWSYEKEWRITGKPSGSPPDSVDINYKGHVQKIPDNMICGIIFGNRMPDRDRNTIRSILNGRNVNFYEAKIIPNKFLLEIIQA